MDDSVFRYIQTALDETLKHVQDDEWIDIVALCHWMITLSALAVWRETGGAHLLPFVPEDMGLLSRPDRIHDTVGTPWFSDGSSTPGGLCLGLGFEHCGQDFVAIEKDDFDGNPVVYLVCDSCVVPALVADTAGNLSSGLHLAEVRRSSGSQGVQCEVAAPALSPRGDDDRL